MIGIFIQICNWFLGQVGNEKLPSVQQYLLFQNNHWQIKEQILSLDEKKGPRVLEILRRLNGTRRTIWILENYLQIRRLTPMQNKVIIGVHGLKNKPSQKLLTRWWLSALNEGLKWIDAGVEISPGNLRLFYWADSMYIKPKSRNEPDGSPFKLTVPYTPAENPPPAYKDSFKKRLDIGFAKKVNDYFYNHNYVPLLNTLAKPIVATRMKELDVYADKTRRFNGPHTAAEYLTKGLHAVLSEYSETSVLLIGHSMGSLVAYDTLVNFPDVSVDLFLTIGSPLVLLGFRKGLAESQKFPGCSWPVVTENIHAWKNYIDWYDPVIMQSLVTLRDYYLTVEGTQIVEDFLVDNTCMFTNELGKLIPDHHSSYGYLRCPEVSAAVRDFIRDA